MKQLETLYTLVEVLAAADDFPWDSDLFIDKNRPWNADSPCAVVRIDKDELDPEDYEAAENPEFARRHNLTFALTMADVQDVVQNARAQDPQANASILVRAFLHYHTYDAFLDLGGLYEA